MLTGAFLRLSKGSFSLMLNFTSTKGFAYSSFVDEAQFQSSALVKTCRESFFSNLARMAKES